jgi:hypothetical protein
VFLALILLSGFAFYAIDQDITQHYNATVSSMNANDQNRNKENIVINQITITSNNTLNVTATNDGPTQSQLIWLGIFNETANPENQTYEALNQFVGPGQTANIVSNVTVTSGNQYLIQLVTELGNTVDCNFYSANYVSCALTLVTAPPTVYQGNNVTVLLTVTANSTSVNSIQSLTATINATPTGLVQLVSNSPLSVTGLTQGTSVFFWWVYNAVGTGTVSFNASYLQAPAGTYALSTAQIVSPPQQGGQGSVTINGVNCTACQNPSGWNLLGSTQNISGSISSLASNDTNYASFSSYYSPTSINHFVDNNSSNVDGSPNIGTESNFTAQQHGPDLINDTLTEADVPIISGTVQYVQSNISRYDTDIGGTSNFAAEQSADNIYDTLTEANTNAAAYIPITFTNTQSSATPSTLQQSITWNPSSYTSYEASNLGNIRFYSDNALTKPLYAWLESCTPSLSNTATNATAWVKLTSPIAANEGTLTIYMAFLSTSMSFDGNYWGIAPNLSPTYGQNDNGANVFSFYDNFAGTTISSAWNTAGAAGTYSVNNGLTVDSGPFPGCTFTLNNQYTGPLIIDAYQVGTTGDWIGASFSNLQTTSTVFTITSGAVQWVYPPEGPSGSFSGLCIASGSTAFTPNPPSTTLQVVTLAVNSTAATEYQNYANPVTVSGTISLTNYPGLVQVAYSTSSDNQTTYWFRLRNYPPNNVMPSVSFGSVTFLIPNYRLDLERQWTSGPYNVNGSKLLCIKTGTFSDEALEVDVWNGASWTVLDSSLVANAWNNISVSSYLTSATFSIRFFRTGDTTQSTWQISSVLLYATNFTDNYQLDIEEQWQNVATNMANQQLCIFAGNWTTAAALEVDGWNTTSSTWVVLNSSLVTNAWNNITLPTGLLTSNFTIRFKNGNPAGDTVQNSWSIDATLLHLWNNQYMAQVEFTGFADLQNWTQIVWFADSNWSTSAVNVTAQLYNYALGNYSSSGDGYVFYISNSTNTDYCFNQTITANLTNFRNSTGYWNVEITGVASTQFQMNVNWIELRDSYAYVNDSIPYKSLVWYTVQATTTNGTSIPGAYASIYANGTTVTLQNATSGASLVNPAWVQLDANGEFQLQLGSATSSGETFVLYVSVGTVVQQKTITQAAQQ